MSVIQTILKQKPVEGFIHEKLTSGLAIIKRFELVGGGGSKDDKDNIDTEQYVDLDEYKVALVDKHGWIIHPLPLLTAVGNDRGGVDFHEGNVGYEHV